MHRFVRRSATALCMAMATALGLPARADDDALPRERQAAAASFVSGGIGDGQSERFKAAARGFPLTIELFEATGGRNDYTADAQVRITDAKGRVVLDEKSDGPFMLVRLPAGDYRVVATLKGKALAERAIRVTDGAPAKTTFVFPKDAG